MEEYEDRIILISQDKQNKCGVYDQYHIPQSLCNVCLF